MRLQPKLRPYINHIFQIVKNGGYSLLPDLLVLEISNRCNLRCKMCWWDFDRQEGDDQLNLTEIKMLIDQIKRFKPNLTITGAEPFIRKDTAEILRYMSDRDINIRSILTNGTLVNGENAEAIVAAGVDLVQVSIDGDEQTHDNVRGVKGSFLKALRGIKRIQSAANSNNCSKPEIRLNCVISSENIHCLDSLVDLAEESRTQLQFQHLMWLDKDSIDKHTRFLDKRFSFKDETVKNLENDFKNFDLGLLEDKLALIKRECEKRKIALSFLQFSDMPTIKKWYTDLSFVPSRHCHEPFFVSRISANGDLKFCPFIDYSFGNIRTESFASLWNNARARSIRSELKNEKLFPGCIRCCKL